MSEPTTTEVGGHPQGGGQRRRGAARGARQPVRVDRPRDDQHAVSHRALGGAQHGARLLLLDRHRRRPAARRGRGPSGARARRRAADRVDARAARRRPRRGRRVHPQRPLPRQHPHRRHHDPGAGVRRRRARVHRLRQGPPGRRRQLRPEHLHAVRARPLRRRAGSTSPACGSSATTPTSTTSSGCAGGGSGSRTCGTATTWRRSARRGSASGGSASWSTATGSRRCAPSPPSGSTTPSGGWARRSPGCPRPA